MVATGISYEHIDSFISLGNLPPPDLCIRTAGEKRISNFLLWQFAYTEFYFADEYWPDFREPNLLSALEDYSKRKRRFGQTDDQVDQTSSAVRHGFSKTASRDGSISIETVNSVVKSKC